MMWDSKGTLLLIGALLFVGLAVYGLVRLVGLA